ncbi:MAG: hypothetical protein PHY62_09350 [Gallionella sp.]|jgi:hypothetical protein|nr:hypothetical protein [Gallionella sp.]
MLNPFELNKTRELTFSPEHPDDAERAMVLLGGLPDLSVEQASPCVLRVSYNLHNYTLEGIEAALTEEGFHLDHSLLHSVGRKVIYYCEDTTCHNMDIPVHPTKMNQQAVFSTAYEHQHQSDNTNIPSEVRDFK